ncbi:uncharacterized protein FMAN_16165 [Fusarium mangiferae]|uniref:Uncharacterized protein n=1 Tax=Fusarium mangiferae TaxID=192010 RepID=A0A1L7TIU6_FUSMA|nr:uncharacterized protein FMAN_16165 [Fusarium mangiferae]CVK98608.1 uncharacterized protein FMAN_16165 [Fusarium mangiferae]
MPLYCLSSNSSTKEKDAPMPARRRLKPPTPQGLRFHPHDGSEKAQERDFVELSNAALGSPLPLHLYLDEFQNCFATAHVDKFFDNIIAAFRAVEQTMARDLAVRLIRAVAQLWNDTFTRGSTNRARVSAKISYRKLTGTAGFKRQLYYPYWFFMAVWLGPGHPLLQSIRKDMSNLWGVRFPTDAIMYPKFVPIETQMSLFYGKPAKPTTPKEASIEERAKAIKKTINDSTINGLSAAIKGHLPDDLDGLGNSTRVHELETNLASTNRDLEEARKKVTNLEKELAESKTLQANMNSELQKTKNDMGTLRQEIQLLKTAQADNVRKDLEVLRATVTGMEAKVLKGERDMITLRNEVAQSAEKAEKAVETGALVLSVLSASGGQKRKRDEIS